MPQLLDDAGHVFSANVSIIIILIIIIIIIILIIIIIIIIIIMITISLFTIGSIYSTYASGVEQMTETNN